MKKVSIQVQEDIGKFYAYPLAFVRYCWPWGKKGTILEKEKIEDWQKTHLKKIGASVRYRKFNGHTPVSPIRISVASGHGIGKLQNYSIWLDTPAGRRQWKDIFPGDFLFGSNGKPTKVIARHEHGVKPIYKISFSDGSSTFAGLEHLWKVKGRKERRNGRDWIVLSTEELINKGVKRPNGIDKEARQWEIPNCLPVEYPEGHDDQIIDPYVLGVWLGDGCKASGSICNPDQAVWDNIRELGYSLGIDTDRNNSKKCETHTLYGLITQLKEAGIYGCRCDNCYVPDNYKYASIEQRLSILQGLLDTDGWVEKKSGTISFGSVSERLVEDVVWLARSLGMIAREVKVKKAGAWYYSIDRENRVPCKTFYKTSITWDGKTKVFRLPRKQELLLHKPEDRYMKRWIDSIEYSHDEEAMCVTVDAEDHLYLTNDFIVTHNSALTSWIIHWIMSTRPKCKGTVTANTTDQLKSKTWAELSKWHKMSINKDWFKYHNTKGNMVYFQRDDPDGWFCRAQTCKEENSEAFAGQHAPTSTSFYLFDEACHDDKTEILTKDGFKLFKDLTPNDYVLTMNPDTHIAEYMKPIALHKHYRQGKMIELNKKGGSFCVTPNHKMYVRYRNAHNNTYNPWKFIDAKDFIVSEAQITRTIKWEADDIDTFTDSDSFYVSKKHLKEVDYKGYVYCAELPKYHLLYTRRNGYCMWSGNSAVPDKIWEVAEGGLTDGEPMFFVFGNPTRNTGAFYDCFGRRSNRWSTMRIDSRNVSRTNKDQLNEWVEDFGEDSDFVRVRVRGMFPKASTINFFPAALIKECMERTLQRQSYIFAPRVIGVDVARFGDDMSVICKRQGLAVHNLMKFRGLDTMDLAARVMYEINTFKPHAVFVDADGLGAGVVDRLRQLKYDVVEVHGTLRSSNKVYRNKRTEMYGDFREWMNGGGSLPDDEDLELELELIEYGYSKKTGQLLIEEKEKIKERFRSPDCTDAVAMTFAYPLAEVMTTSQYTEFGRCETDYPLFGGERKILEKCKVDYPLFN